MNTLFNDPHGTRHVHVCKIYGLDPNYNAKEAGDVPKDTMTWCAQPENSRYPMDTPERTVISWCHANQDRTLSGDARSRVLAGIKQAADWWGVDLPKEQKEEKPIQYTFKVATDSGEDVYKVTDSLAALKYADLVCKQAADFSYDTRRQVAQALLDGPPSIQTGFTPEIVGNLELAAGRMMVSATDIKAACDIRASYLEAAGHTDLGNDLRELGSLAEGDFVPMDSVVKTASMLDYTDRAAGLTAYFKDGTLLPAEQSFGGIPYSHVKQAADDLLPLTDGAMTTRKAVLANRDAVENFFIKLAGEDLSKASNDDLFKRIGIMDALETSAFANITNLCM